MAKFKYELIDYDIHDQDLTIEDLQYLLGVNVVSPFALVRRIHEITAYPILSHPDFSSDVLKIKTQKRSTNCVRFLRHLQRLHEEAQSEEIDKEQDAFSSQIADRRKPLPTVLIKAPQESILGALMGRGGRLLTILTPFVGLKIGQILEFEIFVPPKKERLKGRVKAFVEKVDRRNTTRILNIYEVEKI